MSSQLSARRLLAAIVTIAILGISSVSAQTGQSAWIADPVTGCRVWTESGITSSESFTWSGGCENGLAQGHGVFQSYFDGRQCERYEGGWREGKKSGIGRDTWFIGGCSDGSRYEGSWSDGKRNGHGIRIFGVDGGRFEGEFRDDKANGHGVFDGQGLHYDGEWRDDRPNGRGAGTLPDGRHYEGEWRNSLPNGVGTLTDKDKTYTGDWTNGCLAQGDKKPLCVH